MTVLYPDAPAVLVTTRHAGGCVTLTLSPATRAWVTEYGGWYALLVDDTPYPLTPMRAREDDPRAWAVAQADRVLDTVGRLRADADRSFPVRFDLLCVAPDVALAATDLDAPPRIEAGPGGLLVDGRRVLAVERVGTLALVTVEGASAAPVQTPIWYEPPISPRSPHRQPWRWLRSYAQPTATP